MLWERAKPVMTKAVGADAGVPGAGGGAAGAVGSGSVAVRFESQLFRGMTRERSSSSASQAIRLDEAVVTATKRAWSWDLACAAAAEAACAAEICPSRSASVLLRSLSTPRACMPATATTAQTTARRPPAAAVIVLAEGPWRLAVLR